MVIAKIFTRAAGLAVVIAALTLWSGALVGLTKAFRRSWEAVSAPGPAAATDLLTNLASAAAVLLLVWLALAVLCAAVATVHDLLTDGVGPEVASQTAQVLAPVAVRRVVAGVVGAILLGSAFTTSATADTHLDPGRDLNPAWVDSTSGTKPSAPRPSAGDPSARNPSAGNPSAGNPSAGASRAAIPVSVEWAPLPAIIGATSPVTRGAAVGGSNQVPTPAGAGADMTPTPAGGIAELAPGWSPTAPAPGARAAPRAQIAVPAPALRRSATADDQPVVRRGDTLWDIAARTLGPGASAAEVAAEWPRWWSANRAVIGSDPDHLEPGQRLVAPLAASPSTASPAASAATDEGGRR